MNSQLDFSSGLHQYLKLGMQIWPSLQLSLSNLDGATQPPKNSPLPNRNYRKLSVQQFIAVIVADLHKYIMQHDVKSEHLEQYLQDILLILNADQQNSNTIRFMSRQIVSLISQMQQYNYQRLLDFRMTHSDVKQADVHHCCENQSGDDESGGESGDESGDMDEQQQQIEHSQQQDQMPQQAPLLLEQKQEIQDDGWVVVRSKKNAKKQ